MSSPAELPASLSDLLSPSARALLSASGSRLVRELSMDVVRAVVYDVLTGRNLRDSTEVLTRRKIAMVNLAIVEMFIRGYSLSPDFITTLPTMAAESLQRRRSDKAERWLAQWILGLTDKSVQNVLRDDVKALVEYRDVYIRTCQKAVEDTVNERGSLAGQLELSPELRAEVNWLFVLYLANTVGASTLTLRGSDKSTIGKLFERLVLGSLLSILGFKFGGLDKAEERAGMFVLSSRDKNERESDATLFYGLGQAVRFDIGFIGRGNPEIIKDKLSRFEREKIFEGRKWYVDTFVLADRIPERGDIQAQAARIPATLIQMSLGYWPQEVAQQLSASLGYDHVLVHMAPSEIGQYLKAELDKVRLEQFIGLEDDAG